MAIKVRINGREYEARQGETIREVAKRNGIGIPVLCERAQIDPFGSCRVCLVEQKNARYPVVACAAPVFDGITINTETELIQSLRKLDIELLFSNHFADCVAPCNMTCPAGIDIQGYVGLAANGEYHDAEKLIKEKVPFPGILGRVCPAPCQKECRRNLVDETISIKSIKRFISDRNFERGTRYNPPVAPSSGKTVAIVGAGPAGMSCAYYLAQQGHQCMIIEKLPKAGGMTRYGIPDYRLPQNELDAEIAEIESLGVEFIYNTELGKDVTIDGLRRSFDAVFLAVGAHVSKSMGIPGEELEGVYQGIDFLRDVKLGKQFDLGETVVVVGGGNTAIDAVRTSLRLGAKNCYIVYRRSRAEMPADPIEVHDAEEEGVRFHFLTNPVRIHGKKRMESIESVRMELGEPDASGRRSPVVIEGSEFMIQADTIIMAIGQEPDVACIGADCEVRTTRWSTFVVNEDTFQTDIPEVFAGGDAMRGPCTVVESIADGRNAATQINRFLKGRDLTPIPGVYSVQRGKSLGDLRPLEEEWKNRYPAEPRAEMPMVDPKERIKDFKECELGFAEGELRREAGRCLECGCFSQYDCELRQIGKVVDAEPTALKTKGEIRFEPDLRHPFIMKDQNKCILCGACVRACDELRHVGAWGFVDRGYVTTVQPSFGVALQETDCESCGTCVQNCPTGSLDERFPRTKPVPEDAVEMPGVCTFGGFGCHLNLATVNGRLVSVKAPERDPNNGLLCRYGRYGTRYINNLPRITEPMKRDGDILKPISWTEAHKILVGSVGRIPGKDWGIYAGGRLTLEELAQLDVFVDKNMPEGLKSSFSSDSLKVGQAINETFGTVGSPWSYNVVDAADMVLAVGFDDEDMMTVLGVKIRGAKKNGATLYGLGMEAPRTLHHAFDIFDVSYSPAATLAGVCKTVAKSVKTAETKGLFKGLKVAACEEDDDLLSALNGAQNPVIVISGRAGGNTARWAANLAVLKGCPVLGLPLTPNAQGLLEMGFAEDIAVRRGLFILGEDPVGCAVSGKVADEVVGKADFIVVADAFLTPTVEKADLILPLKVSGERAGTFLSGERRLNRFAQVLKADYPTIFDRIPEVGKTEKLRMALRARFISLRTAKQGVVRPAPLADEEIRYTNGADYLSAQVNWEFEQLEL
ncbi:MAG: FAD-dependent oxidoreductase [Syntrophales bacterium]